jgi:hypothetical protein
MQIVTQDPHDPGPFHPGEREAHRRFGVEAQARELQDVIAGRLSAGNARFMAGQPFFFISVRESDGSIFTQMLACAATAQGIYPLVAIGDAQTFFFLLPAGAGERLLRLARQGGCKAGLVFVDFARRARLRVNGALREASEGALPGFACPPGHRLVEVRVEQAYANCQSRIVRLEMKRPPRLLTNV